MIPVVGGYDANWSRSNSKWSPSNSFHVIGWLASQESASKPRLATEPRQYQDRRLASYAGLTSTCVFFVLKYLSQIRTLDKVRRSRCTAIFAHGSLSTDFTTGCLGRADRANFEALCAWLRKRGAEVSDAISVESSNMVLCANAELGCVAARDVEQGATLLRIPQKCCIVSPLGAEKLLGSAACSLKVVGVDPLDVVLAVALAQERSLGERSELWSYLCMLGEPAKSFPAFFNMCDLVALRCPLLSSRFQERRDTIIDVAEALGLSRDALLSAWQHVAKRRFGCEFGSFMLPVGDLLNHSFKPTCAWEAAQQDGEISWRLYACVRLTKGDPLTFTYREDPDDLLLLTSGFVVADNPFNRIIAGPEELHRCLDHVANPESPIDFSQWRAREFRNQLPIADSGSSLCLVKRCHGGLQWNSRWLDLCGLAFTVSDDVPHWSHIPGGDEGYCATVKRAVSYLMNSTPEEEQASLNGQLALRFRVGQQRLLEDAMLDLWQTL